MQRLTVSFVVVTAIVGALLGAPSAQAAGCEMLVDPHERAECAARQHAREAARAEVEREVNDTSAEANAARPRTAAWQAAIDDSESADLAEVLEPRPIAAIAGLAWFALVLRARLRRRRRAASP